MPVYDSELSVIDTLYNRLTSDSELQELMGSNPPRVHLLWAPENAEFPYITHKVQIDLVRGVIVPATWRVDIWDYSPDALRVYDIRRRVIELMDNLLLPLSDDEDTQHIRVNFGGGGMMGTDAVNVWRYSLVFSCTFTRAGEIRRRLNR